MPRLEFSVINLPSTAQVVHRLYGSECEITVIPWERAWEEMVRVAVYSLGPDVSQLASPWVSNFATMNALRPFTPEEVEALGGPSVFLPSAWQVGLAGNPPNVWAIPWSTDTRVIYYWRDLLEQAGVDEATAFKTPEQMEETLQRLQAGGMAAPWVVQTHYPFATLQNIVSWIWGAGGELLTPDGRRARFTEPAALAGLEAYFRLHRYLPPDIHQLEIMPMIDLFAERKAAVAMSGPNWLWAVEYQRQAKPEGLECLGVALPPGPAYVGGNHLVAWKHTPYEHGAIEFIRLLTSRKVQTEQSYDLRQFPARLDTFADPPYATDPRLQVMVRALLSGRSFPVIRRWGLIEEKLNQAFIQIWDDIAAHPDQDLSVSLIRWLEPLAQRLNYLLKS